MLMAVPAQFLRQLKRHSIFIDHLTKEITYQNNSTPFEPGFQPVGRI